MQETDNDREEMTVSQIFAARDHLRILGAPPQQIAAVTACPDGGCEACDA